jgi:hypothetical protein
VIESIEFCEQEVAEEQSISMAEKDTFCVLNNQGGLGSGTPNCTNFTICVPTPSMGGSSSGGAGLGNAV